MRRYCIYVKYVHNVTMLNVHNSKKKTVTCLLWEIVILLGLNSAPLSLSPLPFPDHHWDGKEKGGGGGVSRLPGSRLVNSRP